MVRACLVLFLTPLPSGCDHVPKELYRDHPMGLAAGALRDTAFMWETRQTDHFRIHFQVGSYAADHALWQDPGSLVRNHLQVSGNPDTLKGQSRRSGSGAEVRARSSSWPPFLPASS